MIALLDFVLSLAAGIMAGVEWLFITMMASGDSGNTIAIVVCVLGLIPSFSNGAILGAIRWKRHSLPAVIVGWLLSSLVTPLSMSLFNPVNAHEALSSKLFAILGMALFAVAGVTGFYSMTRFRSRKTMIT